jgi:carboxypeptidase PM20D1
MDDPGPLIAILEAVEALIESGFTPRRTLLFGFGHDEEVGGHQGGKAIAAVLAARGVRLAFVIDEGLAVTEGLVPGLSEPAALVGVAEKGSVNVALAARGEGGHASIPPRGTAVGDLSRAVAALEANPFPSRLAGPSRALFTGLAPHMGWRHRAVFANLWCFEPVVKRVLAARPSTNAAIRTTAAVTRIEGGIKENVLPTSAHAVVNLRILPGETVAATVARVGRVAGPAVTAEALPGSWDPSPVSDPSSESFRLVARIIRGTYPGAVVAPGLVLGATDSRHFDPIARAVYRFSPLRVGPEDLARIHGVDERLSLRGLEEMIRFFMAVAVEGCGT